MNGGNEYIVSVYCGDENDGSVNGGVDGEGWVNGDGDSYSEGEDSSNDDHNVKTDHVV